MMAIVLLRKRRRSSTKGGGEDENAIVKKVLGALAAMFFGSIFLFLELVGKCKCSADIPGYALLVSGTTVVLYFCIQDVYYNCDEEEDDIENRASIEEDYDKEKNNDEKSLTKQEDVTSSNHLHDICQPLLTSKNVSSLDKDNKQQSGEEIRIIMCDHVADPSVTEDSYHFPTIRCT